MAFKLELPKKGLDFDLGGTIYTLNLDDQSRAAIYTKYSVIEAKEKKNNQELEILKTELQDKTLAIAEKYPDSVLEQQEALFAIDDEYTKKFKKAEEEANKIAKQDYIPFVDTLFGEGKGKELYKQCGSNFIALNKVIRIVMLEMSKENSVPDYFDRYKSKLEQFKENEE